MLLVPLAGRPIPKGALRVARQMGGRHKLMACALRVTEQRVVKQCHAGRRGGWAPCNTQGATRVAARSQHEDKFQASKHAARHEYSERQVLGCRGLSPKLPPRLDLGR